MTDSLRLADGFFIASPSPAWQLATDVAAFHEGGFSWLLPLVAGPESYQVSRMLARALLPKVEPPSLARRSAAPSFEAWASTLGTNADSPHIVVALRDSDLAWPAAIFAAISNRKLLIVSNPESIVGAVSGMAAHSLTLFLPTQRLTADVMHTLLIDCCAQSLPVGFVPGRTHRDAWAWLLRRALANVLYSHHRGRLVVDDHFLSDPQVSATQAYTHEQFDASQIDELASVARDTIILRLHSRESCGLLGSGIVCGRPPGTASETAVLNGRAVPGCGIDGPCLWQGSARVATHEINASHLIVVSCASLRLANALVAPDFSLGINAFTGRVRSYLSASRFVVVDAGLTAFTHDLVSAGLPVGHIALHMNEYLQASDSDLPAFVLLGDPEDRPYHDAPARTGRFEPMIEAPRAVGSVVELTQAPMESAGLSEIVERLYTHERAGFFTGPTSVVTATRSPVRAVVQHLSESIVNDWADCDVERSLWLSHLYQRGSNEHSVAGVGVCGVCSGIANVYRCAGGRDHGRWERYAHNCHRCGIVADGPGPVVRQTLSLPEQCRSGDALSIRLTLHGLGPDSIVAGALSVNAVKPLGWSLRPLPIIAPAEGSPFEVWEGVLRVPRNLPPLVYYVRVYLLIDGLPWFLSRPLVVIHGDNKPSIANVQRLRPLIDSGSP